MSDSQQVKDAGTSEQRVKEGHAWDRYYCRKWMEDGSPRWSIFDAVTDAHLGTSERSEDGAWDFAFAYKKLVEAQHRPKTVAETKICACGMPRSYCGHLNDDEAALGTEPVAHREGGENYVSVQTSTPCPAGCGGFFEAGDYWCPSCRYRPNEQRIKSDISWCWEWFGPMDHRMKCRRHIGHEGEHHDHSDSEDRCIANFSGAILTYERRVDGYLYPVANPVTLDSGPQVVTRLLDVKAAWDAQGVFVTPAEENAFRAGFDAALASRPAPEDAKVKYRVELRQSHQFRHYMAAEVGTEDKAQAIAAQYDKATYDPRIVRTTEVVIETRKKE